jgi:CheY-like chemotaxis protein
LRQISADIALKQLMEQPAELGRERILVAEEDKLLRVMMRTVLYGAGYSILEAIDGEDAVRKFRNSPEGVDLLLLDMDMQKRNGWDVYEEIKQMKPDIKAVFASARPAEIALQRSVVDGDIRILSKPFGSPFLLIKIREVLDGVMR